MSVDCLKIHGIARIPGLVHRICLAHHTDPRILPIPSLLIPWDLPGQTGPWGFKPRSSFPCKVSCSAASRSLPNRRSKNSLTHTALSATMRPIFCGNFEHDARQSDLERLFGRYGKVDRIDMKSGFAFVYMDDERDAEDAIRALDRKEFGRHGRRLRIEWSKQQDRGIRRPGGSRRSSADLKPSKTLFVINFDPINTRTRDLERHFEPYGKVLSVRIRRNFAFIQYDSQEDATKALDATNESRLMDRVISVEYAVRDDDERRNGYSPDRRGRDRSSERGGRDRGRSPSPYGRAAERASPDYGRAPSPYTRPEPKGSPGYGRAESPAYDNYNSPPPRQDRS